MAEQVQQQHNHNAKTVSPDEAEVMRDEAEQVQRQKVAQGVGEVIDTELEELLDAIDEVLEENAQDFVSQYRQAGGE